jgi:hypothetical protein
MVYRLAPMVIATLALALGSCGAASELEQDADCPIANDAGCAQPRGTYEANFFERPGGTCGAKASTRAVVSGERITRFGGQCSGDVEWTDDFCMASFEATCPEEETGHGFYNRQVSYTSYSLDALSRTGVFELEIFEPDGTLYCASIYDSETRNVSCKN